MLRNAGCCKQTSCVHFKTKAWFFQFFSVLLNGHKNSNFFKIAVEGNYSMKQNYRTFTGHKVTKFFKIFTLLLTICTLVKGNVNISQNFVAFSEYMNFTFIISNRLWFLFLALVWLLASLGEWLGAWLPHMRQKKHPTRSMTQTCKENVLCVDEVERRGNYFLVVYL